MKWRKQMKTLTRNSPPKEPLLEQKAVHYILYYIDNMKPEEAASVLKDIIDTLTIIHEGITSGDGTTTLIYD